MKPDAYEISWHRQSLKDNVLDYSPCRAEDGDSEPMFKLSNICKWLSEVTSEEMIALGVNVPSSPYFIESFKKREELIVTSIYKTMIAARIAELEVKK